MILSERFPFVRDGIYLIAWFDTEINKQKLIMEKINPETKEVELHDEIECIHTAVLDIPVAKFEETINDSDFEKKIIRIRSTENLKKIELDPDEKFKAFKSWIAGIAEAGIDAFKIQAEIELTGHFLYAVSWRLMRFLAMVDNEIMLDYLFKIEKDCTNEGIRQESCLIANLIPILDMIMIDLGRFISESNSGDLLQLETDGIEKFRTIISAIFEMKPPLKLFLHDLRYAIFLKFPEAVNILDFRKAFYHESAFVKKVLLLNPRIMEYEEFKNFLSELTEPDQKVRALAAHQLGSTDFDEFKNFLSIKTENSSTVRSIAAGHPSSTKFPEYKNFLSYLTEP